MPTYGLNVVVDELDLDSAVQSESLAQLSYVAVPSRIAGVDSIEIELDAPTAGQAWARISADLAQLHLVIMRIDLDLVNAAEIGQRLTVNRETVRLWARGERRDGFPAPFVNAPYGQMWRWDAVFVWAMRRRNGALEPGVTPFPADVVDAVNGDLARKRLEAPHDSSRVSGTALASA